MRGRFIAYTSTYKRHLKKSSLKAANQLQNTQQEYQNTPCSRTKQDWIEAKRYYNVKAVEAIFRDHRDLTLHRFVNKPGKLLSHLTKERYTPITINRMRNRDGTTTSDKQNISKIFEQYYKALYSPKT